MIFLYIRCNYSKINAVFKQKWGKGLGDYVNVVGLLKRFESGFVVKQAKTFSPQEVTIQFNPKNNFFNILYIHRIYVKSNFLFKWFLQGELNWKNSGTKQGFKKF
jgi:hypothetical protein